MLSNGRLSLKQFSNSTNLFSPSEITIKSIFLSLFATSGEIDGYTPPKFYGQNLCIQH